MIPREFKNYRKKYKTGTIIQSMQSCAGKLSRSSTALKHCTLPDSARHQDTVLRQYSESRAQQRRRNTRDVDTIDVCVTLTDVDHSKQRQNDRRLATARTTTNTNLLTNINSVFEHLTWRVW